MKDVFFRPSANFFGSMEAELDLKLFGTRVRTIARRCGEVYGRRCAAYLDDLPEKLLDTLQRATLAYLIDLLDEHEGEFELPTGLILDEDTDPAEVMHWITPVQAVLDNGILSEEDAPPAFSIKLLFRPVPDEFLEWTVRDDTAVYVGEYADVSPWNEKIMKKKWNYINAV